MTATVRIMDKEYDSNVMVAVERLLKSMSVSLWFSPTIDGEQWQKYCDEITEVATAAGKSFIYHFYPEGTTVDIA